MADIHPTAIIGENVILGDQVTIHPYAVLDGKVEIGGHCVIGPHVHITGWVQIGANTKIYSGAAIGEDPQDYSFDGTPGLVEIGEACIIREGVTIHTPVKGGVTHVGNEVMLMANSHVAHNVRLGDHVVFANGVLPAGFVEVGEYAFLSGNVTVHQFCRVGAFAMVGASSRINQDIPPYCMADGNPAVSHGINVVGLRRREFAQEERTHIKQAYQILFSGKGRKEALAEIAEKFSSDSNVMRLAEFVQSSKRGIISGHAVD